MKICIASNGFQDEITDLIKGLNFSNLHPDLEVMQITDSRELFKLLEYRRNIPFPELIVIGQTREAERVVYKIKNNLSVNPLIIRFSQFYGNDGRIPADAGYHIDAPKTVQTIRTILEDSSFIEAAKSKESKKLLPHLPEGFNALSSLDSWSKRKVNWPNRPIMHEESIRFFHYLDKEGIESLFSQTGKKYKSEVIHRDIKGFKGQAEAGITFGKLLELLGIGGAKASGKMEVDRASNQEYVERLGVENKIRIVNHVLLDNNEVEFLDLEQLNTLENFESPFVELVGWFDTRDYRGKYKREEIENGFVKFLHLKHNVTVGTSLSKYQLGMHHVDEFFGCDGYRSRKQTFEAALRVFGQVIPKGEGMYVKPFSLQVISSR